MNKKNSRILEQRSNPVLRLFQVSPDTIINIDQIVSIKHLGYQPHEFVGSYSVIKVSSGDDYLLDDTTTQNLFKLLGI